MAPSTVINAKGRAEPYKIPDGRGMYLLVNPNGDRFWYWRYRRPDTKAENVLSLGPFPDVPLKRAREKREELRQLLADGIDPADRRRAEAEAGAGTFAALARECLAKLSPRRTPAHTARILRGLERDVFPWLGRKPIGKIRAPDVLVVLKRIEDRGALETAHRVRMNMGEVFAYAIARGCAERNPVTEVPSKFALTARSPRHLAAITKPEKIGQLLRDIDSYPGTFIVRCALRLSPLLFCRPTELRELEWGEVQLDAPDGPQIVIPPARRKLKLADKRSPDTPPHIIPLAPAAVAVLRELKPLTGHAQYVFPSPRSNNRPLSNNALLGALRRMGYGPDAMTVHGFRALASSCLNQLGWNPDAIEVQLSHGMADKVRAAYNRGDYMAMRRRMMAAWADYLSQLRDGADVVPIKRRRA
jgi:integrase